jgi:hypothetical protein
MSTRELKEAINKIKPGKLYPIHTEGPEKFKQIYYNVIIQEIGEKYKLI